jgi:hypothetical protein
MGNKLGHGHAADPAEANRNNPGSAGNYVTWVFTVEFGTRSQSYDFRIYSVVPSRIVRFYIRAK